MASFFVVQSFSQAKRGMKPDIPVQANSLAQARQMAERMAAYKPMVFATVTDGDPARAVLLANAIADAYVEYDRETRREASQQALSWLNQRAAELRTRLLSTREAMAGIVERILASRDASAPDVTSGRWATHTAAGSRANWHLTRV